MTWETTIRVRSGAGSVQTMAAETPGGEWISARVTGPQARSQASSTSDIWSATNAGSVPPPFRVSSKHIPRAAAIYLIENERAAGRS